MLDVGRVQSRLRTTRIGGSIVALEQVETTMAEAFRLAETDALDGLVVTAEEQTAGRGRFGRAWLAPTGSSLLCSVLLRPEASALAGLPILAGLAASEGIEETVARAVRLKWPNDLLLNGRKTGGVLVETRLQGGNVVAVVGIGINVNFDPQQVAGIPETATSLAREIGQQIDREHLLAAILNRLADWRERHQSELVATWERRLDTVGRLVEVTTSDGVLRGYASGVDSLGRLLVQTGDGNTERLSAGEVTFQQ